MKICAINGIGRIGLSILRILLSQEVKHNFQKIYVNCVSNLDDLIYHIKFDSTYGKLDLKVTNKTQTSCKANGIEILILNERDVSKISFNEKVDVVFECTGIFNSKESASKHLKNANFVILSGPSSSCKNIILDVNEEEYDGEDVISIGSCTTNCIAPAIRVLNDNFCVSGWHGISVHAVTNDQSHLDKIHRKDKRRGRSCFQSIIPSSTGASKSLVNIFPNLKGKTTFSCYRVPVESVSICESIVRFKKKASKDSIKSSFEEAQRNQKYNTFFISEEPMVSVDYIKNIYTTCFDSTIFDVGQDEVGLFARIALWYDNEYAFCAKMVNTAKYILNYHEKRK